MQTQATTPAPELRLGDHVALRELDHHLLMRGKSAIDALASLCLEVANKSIHHPSKDGYLSVPAEDLGCLLLCISETMPKAHLPLTYFQATPKEF